MKFLICILLLLPALSLAAPVNMIVVRHAEKAKGEDPDLTDAGQTRAKALARLADIFDIKAVYSSSAKRTISTGTPLAKSLNLNVNSSIGATDYKKILSEASKHSGKTVVVVGHSNTIAGLINAAVKGAKVADISESDYSNIFLIKYDPAGKSELLRYKYSPNGEKLLLEP